MTLSTYASGTQTATVTTEHFLSSPNAVGKFQLYLDLSNMAAGDILEVRAYKMAIASGASRAMWFHAFYGAQPAINLIAMSAWIANTLTDTNAVRFSIKQTFGTGRNFDWLVVQEDATADATKINGSASAAVAQALAANTMVVGTAQTGTLSTTQMSTNLSQTINDFYVGRIIIWTSGTLAGQAANITAYNGTTKVFTYSTTTTAPSNGDTFIIV